MTSMNRRHLAFEDAIDDAQSTFVGPDYGPEPDDGGTVTIHTDSSDVIVDPDCGQTVTVTTNGDDVDVDLTTQMVDDLEENDDFDDSIDVFASRRTSLKTARSRHSRGDKGEFSFEVDPSFAYDYLLLADIHPDEVDASYGVDSIDDLSQRELVLLAMETLIGSAYYVYMGVSAKEYESGTQILFSGEVDSLENFYEDEIEPVNGTPWQEFAYEDGNLETDEGRDFSPSYDIANPRHAASRRMSRINFRDGSILDSFSYKNVRDGAFNLTSASECDFSRVYSSRNRRQSVCCSQ